ncbi:hypothetical protein PY32053_01746 [Paracoccus yeei]|uniref:Uncharacterized protein n=1 Tax=Paracoccus yeei TaxID=147645 RepID=A0A386UKY3_9RHOB|nr:hypothetical protein PY32053_01746 [Paracoccus yeei]
MSGTAEQAFGLVSRPGRAIWERKLRRNVHSEVETRRNEP